MLSESETAIVHALRVRHGLACVRAATLSARAVPNLGALAKAAWALEEVGRRLGDDQIDESLHVLELLEHALDLAEQLLAAAAAGAPGHVRRWPTPFGSA